MPPEDTPVKPHLIIISGPPAAGKSTSARPLACEIGYVLLCMDEVKERLADVIGKDTLTFTDALGDAAIQTVISLAREMLHHNVNVIVEGFFQSDRYSDAIALLAKESNAVLVHIKAADSVLKHRYEHRALAENRHWIHGDLEKIGTLKPELPQYMAEPLHLNIPGIFIDTSDAPMDISAVAARIRSTLEANA